MIQNLNALIIDDENHCCESLTALLELYCPNINVLDSAKNIQDALTILHQSQPQIVFLDIEIGEENGFDLLKRLFPFQFQLIFTTGHAQFAHEAFRVNAADYLLKPIVPDDLKRAVRKAEKRNRNNQVEQNISQFMEMMQPKKKEKLSINTSDGTIFIDTQQIMNVEGSGNYSTFYMQEEEKITASKGLKFYEELLPLHSFFRTHQSHLINMNFVKKIWSSDSVVELTNGRQVPLSKNKKNAFLTKMME